MILSLFQKEWIKLRWYYLGGTGLTFLMLIYLSIDMRETFEFYKPIEVWLFTVHRKVLYYSIFRYIPLFLGLMFAMVQTVPEISRNRIRLAFQLPVSELKTLDFMVTFGIFLLLSIYIIMAAGLYLVSIIYFPVEIAVSCLITLFPWLLAGIAGYLLCTATALDPSWLRRIVLTIIGLGYVSLLFGGKGYSTYAHSLWKFLLLTIALFPSVLLSGYRIRRGYH